MTRRILIWRGWIVLFKWSLTFTVCGLCAWGLYSFKAAEISHAMEEAAAWPEPAETVEVSDVHSQPFVPSINVLGELVAPKQITLQNELAGQVVAVNFRSGDSVAKGNTIVQLDVSTETAQLESAKADLKLAQSTHQRSSRLAIQNATSRAELDRDEAALKNTEATIRQLQSMIDKKTLRAPFSGTLGLFELSTGQFLDVNTNIASFVGDGEQMWIDFSVPQFYDGPQPGESVQVFPIRNDVGNDSESAANPAVVIAKDNVVMADSRSVQYRARVPRHNFRPKQMVEVRVPVGPEEQLITVPSAALQHDTLGQYVYVLLLDPDSNELRAQRRQVVVSEQIGDTVFVSDGLQQGEQVAARGAFKLRDGTLTLSAQSAEISDQESAETSMSENTLSESAGGEGQ